MQSRHGQTNRALAGDLLRMALPFLNQCLHVFVNDSSASDSSGHVFRVAYNVSLDSLHAKRAAIIYNPVARGISKRRNLLQSIVATLAAQGTEAKLVATEA